MKLLTILFSILNFICYVQCGDDVMIDVETKLDVGQKLQENQKVCT